MFDGSSLQGMSQPPDWQAYLFLCQQYVPVALDQVLLIRVQPSKEHGRTQQAPHGNHTPVKRGGGGEGDHTPVKRRGGGRSAGVLGCGRLWQRGSTERRSVRIAKDTKHHQCFH